MVSRTWTTTPFVGREEEMGVLRALLDQACAGRGGIGLLVGEPGIGKTRTAEELASDAHLRGARVVWGRSYEGDGAPAYWPWVQILRSLVRGRDESALRSCFGSGVADVAQILPELQERMPDLTVPSIESPQARFRLFESIASFVRAIAEQQPLVLIFDDLHWADRPTLLLLQHLAGELKSSRLLVLGTYRDVEVSRQHPLAQTLAELTREQVSQRVTLRGLDEHAVAQIVALTMGADAPAPLVTAIRLQTEGNPFFVAETVRLLCAEGDAAWLSQTTTWSLKIPPGVREVIGQRLARLSRPCNDTLEVAAIIGREFSLAVLQQVSGLETKTLLEALEEAETARVIVALPRALGCYSFSHALIRETLYEDLPAARRVRLHGQVGAALEAFYGSDVEAHLAEVAHHFLQAAPAGAVAKAIGYARLAGERAMAVLAYEEAVGHYEHALQAWDLQGTRDVGQQCELHLAFGDALRKAGEPARAIQTFQRAAELARGIHSSGLLSRAALGVEDTTLSAGLPRVGLEDPSVRLLEEALAALGNEQSAEKSRVLAALARALVFSGLPARGAELTQQAVALARQIGDPATLVYALDARRIAIWGPDNLEERLAVATEIVHLAESTGDKEKALDGRLWRQNALLEIGDLSAADAEMEAYARLAEVLRQPLYRCYVPLLRANRALLTGKFAEAEHLSQQGFTLGLQAQSQNAGMIHAAQMMAIRREQGRIQEMEAVFSDYADRFVRARTFHYALALLYCESGRQAEAERAFERLAAHDFADLTRTFTWLINMAFLAEVCTFLGDTRRAATLYRLLSPHAAQNILGSSAGPYWGSTSRYLGLLATTLRLWNDAIRHFETALEGHARLGARPWMARSQFDYARMLLARDSTGDREQAAPLLAQSLATAEELEMGRLAEQALKLVDRMEGPRSEPVPGCATLPAERRQKRRVESVIGPHPDKLSSREVEVLCLVARGRSNREIAEELVLSVRTVEHHVANVYAKIGARGRADATAYALRQGFIPVHRQ